MSRQVLALALLLLLAASPAAAQEWTLSTVLGDMVIEALAVAPDGTAWAGQSNSIYRFDGSSWTVVTTVTGWTHVEFFGAAAPANDCAHFSGYGYPPAGGSKGSLPTSIYLPIVCRQSGGARKTLNWWEVGLHVAPWELSAHLWATGNGSGGYDVWAAASNGIYKSSNDGASWVTFTDPGVGYFQDIAGSGNSNIWASGADSENYKTCLYHYNGSYWTLFTSSFGGSSPVVCVPNGGAYCAFGNSSDIAEVYGFDGGNWTGLTAISNQWPNGISSSPQTNETWLGTSNTLDSSGGIYHYDGSNWHQQTSLPATVYAVDASCPGVTWAATTGAVYYRGQPIPRRTRRADYNGDGTSDISIFRPASGLWAIRGITRLYFGGSTDDVVPGDYSGSGTWDPAVFRANSGLWAIRGVTRVYFGGSTDDVVPGDYSGNGTWDPAVFRPSTGLWAIRGVTRLYFGDDDDSNISGDYSGNGTWDPGIFRSSSGLWAIHGVTRLYFGGFSDYPVPGDFSGNGSWDPAIFRPNSGLWAIRGVTRTYLGGSSDYPIQGDYEGTGTEVPGVFRPSAGLWAIRGVTRAYFGSSGDVPAALLNYNYQSSRARN